MATVRLLGCSFQAFFFIVHDTGQQLTIDRTNFLMDGFLQIIQHTGFVSVNTRFQIPPKEKITRWKIGRARGPRHVSEMGSKVPGKHVSNNGHWLVCSVCCGTILLKPHIRTVYSSILYLLSTTHSKDVRFPWVTLCLCVCVCVCVYIYSSSSVALVRERTIPTERPPPVGEVSAHFCG